jgi:hypothetical protein
MCVTNQYSLKSLLILLCYMYYLMQKTLFVCQHISPYADYFNILIVTCTNIHTHYVHIRAYPRTTYV